MKKRNILLKIVSAVALTVSSVIYVLGTEPGAESDMYPVRREDVYVLEEAPHLAEGQLININLAREEELVLLPGIGEVKARAIIAYREEHGPFASPEELIKVDGIGDKTLERLASLITIGEDTHETDE